MDAIPTTFGRERPGPTARAVFADIEGIAAFRSDWRGWADRLGIGSGPESTLLGDGAEWVRNAAAAQFGGCRQVLDVFHAPEHVGTAAKALYGEGTDAARASFESGRAGVLPQGWAGVCRYVGGELSRADTTARRAALDELVGHMKNHAGRMGYRLRLAEGRGIGSGLIEGQVKTLGLRLKARGARWLERNTEHMAAPGGLGHSRLWENYWSLTG